MKYLLVAASAMILTLSACVNASRPGPLDGRALMQRALDDTVILATEDGRTFCSGVLHRGLVITAHHCIEGGMPFTIALRSAEHRFLPAEVLLEDEAQDLALVRVVGRQLQGGADLAQMMPDYGDGLVVVGHPFGLAWTVTNGVVSHPRREGGVSESMVWMQISAPIAPGNSGGPVFNEHGQIAGIVSFYVGGKAHLAGVSHLENIARIVDAALEN